MFYQMNFMSLKGNSVSILVEKKDKRLIVWEHPLKIK